MQKKPNDVLFPPPLRSDMAYERHRASGNVKGVCYREKVFGEIVLSALTVQSEEGAAVIGKPKGRYFSLHFPPPAFLLLEERERLITILSAALRFFLPQKELRLLVAGLGNRRLTADSFGPLAADGVSATAVLHEALLERFALRGRTRIAVCTPDVFAETGIESTSLIRAAKDIFEAEALLVFDALAATDKERLLCAIELTDTGTVPGAGVKNKSVALSEKTLGIPTAALGVPTVLRTVDGFFLVPAALDEGVRTLSAFVAEATNRAFGAEAKNDIEEDFSLRTLFALSDKENKK